MLETREELPASQLVAVERGQDDYLASSAVEQRRKWLMLAVAVAVPVLVLVLS